MKPCGLLCISENLRVFATVIIFLSSTYPTFCPLYLTTALAIFRNSPRRHSPVIQQTYIQPSSYFLFFHSSLHHSALFSCLLLWVRYSVILLSNNWSFSIQHLFVQFSCPIFCHPSVQLLVIFYPALFLRGDVLLWYCFATMRLYQKNETHDGVDHAWFIFNLHTENSLLYFVQLHR